MVLEDGPVGGEGGGGGDGDVVLAVGCGEGVEGFIDFEEGWVREVGSDGWTGGDGAFRKGEGKGG